MAFKLREYERLCEERRALAERLAVVDSKIDLVGARAAGRTLDQLRADCGLSLSAVQQRLLPRERRRSRAAASVDSQEKSASSESREKSRRAA